MYGSSAFVPKPMIWPGVTAPRAVYGSSFYNPNRTEAGQENLENFLSALSGIFKYVSEDKRSEIREQVNALNIPDGQLSIDDTATFLDSSAADAALFEDLISAGEFKQQLEDVCASLGQNLENWSDCLNGSGAYDSQIIFPLLEGSDGLSISVPAEIISRIDGHIDAMTNGQLAEACSRLGVSLNGSSAEDYVQARTDLKSAIAGISGQLSSFPQINSDSLNSQKEIVKGVAITPGIGMVGVNIAGRGMARTQEQSYRAAKNQAEALDRETKKMEMKKVSRRKSMRKEMLAKANSNKKNTTNKSKRRGKV